MNLKEINEAIKVAGQLPAGDKAVGNLHYAAMCLRNRLAASRKINVGLRKRIRELEARNANNH